MRISDAILAEISTANAKYGPFTSAHEALGVLLEEVDELRDAIHRNHLQDCLGEAAQVAAVAFRLMQSLRDHETTRARSGMEPPAV